MEALKIDESKNDLVMENGSFVWVTDKPELEQEVRSVLKTCIYEWFLDPTHGLDYTVMRGKNVDEEEVSLAIHNALSQVDRITSVDRIDISFNREDRKMNVSIRATAGEEVISEVMEL